MPGSAEAMAPHAVPPRGWQLWWLAARPRTLSIALAPVLLGTSLAWAQGAPAHMGAALAALVCAVLIQVATNLFNDVADFECGVDRPGRLGPPRVTAAGWARPAAVRRAAWMALGLALLLGAALVWRGGWVILLAGLGSLAAAWAYSCGPLPLSRTPLGEVFVWVFFGVVATVGSHYLQSRQLTGPALLAGAALGALAAAVLLVNNHRDRDNDLAAGRRTLAAALGTAGTLRLYGGLVLAPLLAAPALAWSSPQRPWALLGLATLPLCLAAVRHMARARGPQLNAVLAETARLQLVFSVLLAVGLSL
jgi:1,4-dihydroxy-2-naphthoate octaprenyltransferase